MYDILFLDLDDTILDFKKAEGIALSKTLRELGVDPTEALLEQYHHINIAHWQRLEKGELTRDQVLVGRFRVRFEQLGIPASPEACAAGYEHNLAIGHYFLPGALEAVQRLHRRCRLFLASNGTAAVQDSRLTSAGLYPYFEQIFISQEVGADKPSPAYFSRCFARIPDFDPSRAMIAGDSLTSDIRGGLNAGIATCWVNTRHLPPDPAIRPDYEIASLSQLELLLDRL